MSVTYINKTYSNAIALVKDVQVVEAGLDYPVMCNLVDACFNVFRLAPDTSVVLSIDVGQEASYIIHSKGKKLTKAMCIIDFIQSVHCFTFLKQVKV